MCHELLPQMIERGGGSIVNVAAEATLSGFRDRAAYRASAGAVIALSRAIAVDHAAAGVGCNVVCVDIADSQSAHVLGEDSTAGLGHRRDPQPTTRSGIAQRVASMVAFLAGERSPFTTGAVFAVDGGLTAA